MYHLTSKDKQVSRLQDLKKRYQHHPAVGARAEKHERVRTGVLNLAVELDKLCPESAELERALDALDVAMWAANAALARHS